MKLGDRRREFSERVPLLINYALTIGYKVAIKDVHRHKNCGYGSPTSMHQKSLAIDLDLYLNGVYLKKTSDHTVLGIFWESLGGVWGGRFNDGNHYQAPPDAWVTVL